MKTAAKKEEKTPVVSTPVPKRETLADTVEYQITGNQGSYTLKPGESLVRVALKFYGNKKLWPYLVKHNKLLSKIRIMCQWVLQFRFRNLLLKNNERPCFNSNKAFLIFFSSISLKRRNPSIFFYQNLLCLLREYLNFGVSFRYMF